MRVPIDNEMVNVEGVYREIIQYPCRDCRYKAIRPYPRGKEHILRSQPTGFARLPYTSSPTDRRNQIHKYNLFPLYMPWSCFDR